MRLTVQRLDASTAVVFDHLGVSGCDLALEPEGLSAAVDWGESGLQADRLQPILEQRFPRLSNLTSILPAGTSTFRLRIAAVTSWTVTERAAMRVGDSHTRIE